MMRRFRCGAGALLAGLMATGWLRAEPQPEAAEAVPTTPPSFSLELSPGGCPSTSDEIAAAIRARVPNAVRRETEADVAVVAQLSSSGAAWLTVTLAQGQTRREFPGASCEEASALVAFITALVLDARPEDRLKATERAAAAEAKEAEPPPEPELPEPPPTREASAPAVVGAPRATDTSLRFVVSAAATLETAVAPTPPLGALAGIGVEAARPGWFSPELRAAVLATTNATQSADVGAVRFRLLAGRLSFCPVRPRLLRGTLSLGACVTFDAGGLRAQGDSRVSGVESAMPWLAGGAALLAVVPLGASWQLELQAGAKALAHHDRFELEPDPAVATSSSAPRLLVHEVPLLSGGFAVGVGFKP